MLCTVQGGTGAGSRMHIRQVPKQAWSCTHGHPNPGYTKTCLTAQCSEKRDS